MPDYEEKYREQVRKFGATRTFDLYADPGHSWLKVPKKLLNVFNIGTLVTPYSYQHGEFAYLEEDVDAPLFINAFEGKYGVSVKIREHVSRERESKIRSYYPYDAQEVGQYDSAEEEEDAREHGEEVRDCPECEGIMARQEPGGPFVCVKCGATMGEYRPRAPMRREVRVRGHGRRVK